MNFTLEGPIKPYVRMTQRMVGQSLAWQGRARFDRLHIMA